MLISRKGRQYSERQFQVYGGVCYMNALIIGGSGGLSSVVAKLAMKKYRVWAVTRGVRELPRGVIPIKADRNDLEKLEQGLKALRHVNESNVRELLRELVPNYHEMER